MLNKLQKIRFEERWPNFEIIILPGEYLKKNMYDGRRITILERRFLLKRNICQTLLVIKNKKTSMSISEIVDILTENIKRDNIEKIRKKLKKKLEIDGVAVISRLI